MKISVLLLLAALLSIPAFILKPDLPWLPKRGTGKIPLCAGGACKTPSRQAFIRVAVPGAGTKPADVSGMVLIKGGQFQMGTDEFADAKPIHTVSVSSFWMDTHEVTNVEFAAFVKATGYITVAERPLNPAEFPGVPTAQLVPGSAVFSPPNQNVSLTNYQQWWQYVPGAN